jgi:2-keto-3-deoxy-L-rhamnonate aldolase RhmA
MVCVQVREVMSYSQYPPVGARGNALGRAFVDFKSHPNVSGVMRDANQQLMIVVQIETREAADQNCEEIVCRLL